MSFGAVGNDARGDAEEGGIEGENALDVREHERVRSWRMGRRSVDWVVIVDCWVSRSVNGLFGAKGDGGFGGDDATHRVANKDDADGGVNGG